MNEFEFGLSLPLREIFSGDVHFRRKRKQRPTHLTAIATLSRSWIIMSDPSSLTIENLLSLLVCEWQNTRYSPMGRPIVGVHQNGEETCISLTPLTMHQSGCPRNFKEFFDAAKSLNGMKTKGEAFIWYCRSRLHYACSTVCVTFTEFIFQSCKTVA